MKSIIEKIGAKAGARAIFINAPVDAMAAFDVSQLKVGSTLKDEFNYIHLFCRTQDELEIKLPRVKGHLAPTGMLWVSWPKAGQLTTDLSLPTVIRIGYQHGMVESKAISINDTWSALKFTFPKEGVVYKNHFGTLPD
ncbi:MAG TPA: hypothetical protein VK658_18620 [Chryseolinea sp.]|nr:hypothetical protein [Chryseolinea sp.]